MNELLIVRGDDLVILGATVSGCTVSDGRLVAVEAGASLTVHFPPQAVSETKVENAEIQGGVQGRSSSILYPLEPGTEIRLDVAGFLEALAGLDIPPLDTTRIELPAGLIQKPTAPAARGAGPVESLVADGVNGVWEYVVRAAGSNPLMLHAHAVLEDDDGYDVHPLDKGERGTIKLSGVAAVVERLRLSALGGTLTSSLAAEALHWDHVTALGRDQRVRWEQPGVLYPFGHPAVLQETVVRRVQDGTASLHRETVLRVTHPVHHLTAVTEFVARAFPFSRAEMLTTTLPGIDHVNPVETFTRPPDVRDAMVQRQQAARAELENARAEFADTYRQPIPQDASSLEGHPLDTGNAMDVRQLGSDIAALEQEQRDIIEGGTVITEEGTRFVPQAVFDRAHALDPQINELKGRRAVAQQRFDTFELPFLQRVRPSGEELANRDLYARRLAETENDWRAAQIVTLLAEIARLGELLGPQATAPTVSRVLDPPVGGGWPVRCTGRLGDVVLHVPLFFVHDLRVPADDFFGGYSSLDDPSILAGVPEVSCDLPGTAIDVVRRPEGARTTDVQEVHAVGLGAIKSGREILPALRSFTVELPELRTLLPEGAPTRVTARLDGRYLEGGPAKDVIRFDTPVPVDFDKHAERGGALVTPTFAADVVSDEYGPIDRRMLPGGVDPLAALANMRLFGIPLASLLTGFTAPPSILQFAGPDGVPRGVRLTWPEQPPSEPPTGIPLRSNGAFVAHRPEPLDGPDTTTVRLTVEQDLSTRSTECVLTAFTLRLPTPQAEVLRLSFDGVTFREGSGREPTFEVNGFGVSFEGALRLIKDLQEKVSAALGGSAPQIELRADGVSAIFAIRVPDASSGAFLMRNVVVHIGVHIPFRGGSPGVRLSFASREAPFQLSVPPFGGGGYAAIALEGSKLTELDISLEFGGMINADFAIVKAEVHALGGVRSALIGGDVLLAGYLRIGGSVSLFGLAHISIEMRIELIYDGVRNQLAGRATLVIEIDLTLYADSVELDSGLWVFAGGSNPPPPPDFGEDVAQQGWSAYQGAYA
ncbi:hypothetical protein GA0074695_4269 [Micromonospora viridifaciens]|uniref:Uncharacterized protein n=1 Tax=Micromonospora viridifaciens TaxID=1881 RepID=A0A1C4YGV2_MICVI|nr:hypothetical protein [Micromonospora viridifaciens]SCF19947.1 hypothetical protein GA0074695_4269 [Micromonospora viridifaciens]